MRRQLQLQMAPPGGEALKPLAAIHVDVSNLELRARNLYTGACGQRCKVAALVALHVAGSSNRGGEMRTTAVFLSSLTYPTYIID